MTILGMAGYARSGKNTVGDILAERGFEQRAFADKIREALVALDPPLSFGREGGLAELVERYGWDELKEQSPTTRELMQRMGTEVGRELFGETFWIDQCLPLPANAEEETRTGLRFQDIVVTDVRFPNDVQRIRDLGGYIWWIERGLQPVNDHPSDNSLSAADCDLVIDNDGTLDDLASKVYEALDG